MSKHSGKFKEIFCVLFGHSKIQSGCFGYWSCGRCDQQLGDSLAGAYSVKEVVIIGHDCKTCQENYKKCTWRDKWFAPNPFKKSAEQETETDSGR